MCVIQLKQWGKVGELNVINKVGTCPASWDGTQMLSWMMRLLALDSKWTACHWPALQNYFSFFHYPNLQSSLSFLKTKLEHLAVGHMKDARAIWQWHLSLHLCQAWSEGFGSGWKIAPAIPSLYYSRPPVRGTSYIFMMSPKSEGDTLRQRRTILEPMQRNFVEQPC